MSRHVLINVLVCRLRGVNHYQAKDELEVEGLNDLYGLIR